MVGVDARQVLQAGDIGVPDAYRVAGAGALAALTCAVITAAAWRMLPTRASLAVGTTAFVALMVPFVWTHPRYVTTPPDSTWEVGALAFSGLGVAIALAATGVSFLLDPATRQTSRRR